MTAAQVFLQGVSHFDNFERADTAAGSISTGPQGQSYELFSSFALAPDADGRISAGRFVMAPPTTNANRAVYAMNTVSARVKRLGGVVHYSDDGPGAAGFVWTLILSRQRNRFADDMLHFTGNHIGWRLEIWNPNGSIEVLAQHNLATRLALEVDEFVDLSLEGDKAIVSVSGEIMEVTSPALSRFADARVIILEHFANAPPKLVNRYSAWYYLLDGGTPLPVADFVVL